jgi:hypothetical protein
MKSFFYEYDTLQAIGTIVQKYPIVALATLADGCASALRW